MADSFSNSIDATLAGFGHKAAITGGGGSAISWLLSSEAGILIGILIGIAGLLMQWHYSRKRDRREQAEHEMRMGRKP